MSEEQKHTTTEEQYERFVAEARYWIVKFGLLDWFVQYECNDTGDEGTIATCLAKRDAGCVVLTCNSMLNQEDAHIHVPGFIERFAFHEVCELLLSEMTDIMYAHCSHSRMATETHRVIRTLESVVWRPDWEARQ